MNIKPLYKINLILIIRFSTTSISADFSYNLYNKKRSFIGITEEMNSIFLCKIGVIERALIAVKLTKV